jgi:hypothetical protein
LGDDHQRQFACVGEDCTRAPGVHSVVTNRSRGGERQHRLGENERRKPQEGLSGDAATAFGSISIPTVTKNSPSNMSSSELPLLL